jgi:hypothetical protein
MVSLLRSEDQFVSDRFYKHFVPTGLKKSRLWRGRVRAVALKDSHRSD